MANNEVATLAAEADRLIELERKRTAEREAQITALAEGVGSHVTSLVAEVVDGGEYPDELKLHTAHDFYIDRGYDYTGGTFAPAIKEGFAYQTRNQFQQSRLVTDLQIATLHALGGSAPQWLVEEIMSRPPIGVLREDIVTDTDGISYDTEEGQVVLNLHSQRADRSW